MEKKKKNKLECTEISPADDWIHLHVKMAEHLNLKKEEEETLTSYLINVDSVTSLEIFSVHFSTFVAFSYVRRIDSFHTV